MFLGEEKKVTRYQWMSTKEKQSKVDALMLLWRGITVKKISCKTFEREGGEHNRNKGRR